MPSSVIVDVAIVTFVMTVIAINESRCMAISRSQ